MSDAPHIHRWQVLAAPDKLQCVKDDCRTVSDIKTVINNVQAQAAHNTKLKLLIAQIFAGSLKKHAHDEAYAWVSAHSEALDKQGALL